ncbi:MAG: hypothetical protein K2I74_03440 [Treponemataceae bacterium]|nr:hypothetical protein [Treponemataceae bacterium]
MKGIKKYFLIFAALAAALTFVSCTDEDDSTVAVYKGSEDGVTVELTFFDDNTWEAVYRMNDLSVTGTKGAYSGDPSKDGIIIITVTHMVDEDMKLKPVTYPAESLPIVNGKLNLDGAIFTRQ